MSAGIQTLRTMPFAWYKPNKPYFNEWYSHVFQTQNETEIWKFCLPPFFFLSLMTFRYIYPRTPRYSRNWALLSVYQPLHCLCSIRILTFFFSLTTWQANILAPIFFNISPAIFLRPEDLSYVYVYMYCLSAGASLEIAWVKNGNMRHICR